MTNYTKIHVSDENFQAKEENAPGKPNRFQHLPRNAFIFLSRLFFNMLGPVIKPIAKPVIKPLGVRAKELLLNDLVSEINYMNSQQNRLNNELLSELRSIRQELQEKNKRK